MWILFLVIRLPKQPVIGKEIERVK